MERTDAAAAAPHPEEPGLLIASNRLPVLLRRDDDGRWRREAGSGGLVTALEPVLRARGGTWVGWPGVESEELDDAEAVLDGVSAGDGYRVVPVSLRRSERRDFYLGFSNQILWPLFHGLLDRCRFESRYWDVYRRVNRKFARTIHGAAAGPGQLVWVHDYHLMGVGRELRAAGLECPLGFFLHIPFPPPDLFEHLPWSREVLDSLLCFDVVGFQTRRDRHNFLDCVRILGSGDCRIDGERVRKGEGAARSTKVGVHPISIDNRVFADGARTDEMCRRADALREEIGSEVILLGVDRLDYTKGIPQKLKGFERALHRHPELRGRVTLVQLVIPSRVRIPEYHRMKEEIEGLVGRINGRFTQRGWAPILYQFGTWSQQELLAFYRAADVALVTPLRDGMNLVSKEYVAASVERGTLVLSEFAGSADELRDSALLVNPHDVEALARAIGRAATMPARERRERLERMQAQVREHDIHAWVRAFLEAVEPGKEPAVELRPRTVTEGLRGEPGPEPRRTVRRELVQPVRRPPRLRLEAPGPG